MNVIKLVSLTQHLEINDLLAANRKRARKCGTNGLLTCLLSIKKMRCLLTFFNHLTPTSDSHTSI